MSPERRQFRSTAILNNSHGEQYCVCCLNYKGKEVEGCELKLNRLTTDKKLRQVRWSPLSETGQKSDMFATTIRTLFYTILFTLFRTKFFQYPDAFKIGMGVYVLSLPFLHYNETCGLIRDLTLSAACQFIL